MANKMLRSPSRYVQGKGVLGQLDEYINGMGNNLLIIIDGFIDNFIHPQVDKAFEGKDFTLTYDLFSGECCQSNIDRLAAMAKDKGITAVIGIGGGKTLDTTKGVGYYANIPVVIVPTVASTDAPCSSCSVIYHEDGVFDRYLFLDTCPDMILVDTGVVVGAPVKLLVAGMGDAMATYFEARACRASGSNNQIGNKPTRAATTLATLCWENLRENGLAAKQAVEAGVCTEAVEIIIETNTYLSGVGFESGGLAAAHGIQKGFTVIPELHRQLHGFNVAFCTCAQLVLENSLDELEEVMEFSHSVGLPICFADLGYPNPDKDVIRQAAEKACVPGSTIHNLPFEVTPEMVADALVAADAYGNEFHKLYD